MATLDSVEKLKERANVSYEEARAALDACNDDLLEAVIYLENNGKVPPPRGSGFFSTLQTQPGYNQAGGTSGASANRGSGFGDALRRFGKWTADLVRKGNANRFEVWRGEERHLAIPVTLLVILLVCCFWITLPLMVVGLFFGCRYRFKGQEMEGTKVNSVMDSVAQAADNIKNEVWHPENKSDQSE